MRLGDLDELEHYFMTKMRYLEKDMVMDAAYMVNKAPTVDAVAVVRCKNCEYWGGHDGNVFSCTREFDWFHAEPDDFCSKAKRKTTE